MAKRVQQAAPATCEEAHKFLEDAPAWGRWEVLFTRGPYPGTGRVTLRLMIWAGAKYLPVWSGSEAFRLRDAGSEWATVIRLHLGAPQRLWGASREDACKLALWEAGITGNQ